MVWNAFHRVAVCYILESWFSGTVSGVWLLLGCDLSQAPHHLSFSSHCLFLEPGPPAFPFALELADIFSVHIFSAYINQIWFLLFATKNPDWCTCWATWFYPKYHRIDIIPTRSGDSVYMQLSQATCALSLCLRKLKNGFVYCSISFTADCNGLGTPVCNPRVPLYVLQRSKWNLELK